MKKLLIGILTVMLVSGQAAYADGPSSWATDEVLAAQGTGLTTEQLQIGYTEAATRAEFSELIVKTYKVLTGVRDIEISDIGHFSDTQESYILEAYEIGLMNGTGGGYFTPQGYLTREAMVVAFCRLIEAVESDSTYTMPENDNFHGFDDLSQISEWAYESMIQALDYGIISGIGNNLLAPQEVTSKEQVLIINYRITQALDAISDLESSIEEAEELEEEDVPVNENTDTNEGIITCDLLNLRREPEITEDNIMNQLTGGSKVIVIEETGEWYGIDVDGLTGYVHKEFVYVFSTTENTSEIGLSIRDYAIQFVGTPYVYGGSSLTAGTDCSGFTQSVFEPYGFGLSRSAAGQGLDGYAISREDLMPGDLVTYGYGNAISHVALYIGDGQIIHATVTYGIKVTEMEGFLYKPLIGFRRVIFD